MEYNLNKPIETTMDVPKYLDEMTLGNECNLPSVVLEIGSRNTKVGCPDLENLENLTYFSIPSVVGVPQRGVSGLKESREKVYVGDEALTRKSILSLKYPIEHGYITNFDNMKDIWSYALYDALELSKKKDFISLIILEPLLNPESDRRLLCRTAFEEYNVLALRLLTNSQAALFSYGISTGIVLDIGASVVTSCAIYEGNVISSSISIGQVSGNIINDYLMKLLREGGYDFKSTTSDKELIREIKEKCCYVSLNFNEEYDKYESDRASFENNFLLPDDRILTIGSERFQVTECLFSPYLVGKQSEVGIHNMIYNTLMKSHESIRKELLGNIILSGGSSHFPGLIERTKKELSNILPDRFQIKNENEKDFEGRNWLGGVYSSSCTLFPWITRDLYDFYGPSVIDDIKVNYLEDEENIDSVEDYEVHNVENQ